LLATDLLRVNYVVPEDILRMSDYCSCLTLLAIIAAIVAILCKVSLIDVTTGKRLLITEIDIFCVATYRLNMLPLQLGAHLTVNHSKSRLIKMQLLITVTCTKPSYWSTIAGLSDFIVRSTEIVTRVFTNVAGVSSFHL
jgi:hypothetical protein